MSSGRVIRGIVRPGPRGPAGVGGNSVVGGVLSGQLPNPSFAVDMATQVELGTEAASRISGDATLTAALVLKADLVGGKVPTSQLPAIAVGGETFIVGSQASQLALDAEIGDIAVRTDQSKTYVNNGGTSGTMSDWTQILTPGSDVTAVNGQTGAVVLGASDVGAQPVAATLTALVALTPSNDDVLQRKAGAWVNRTPAQLKADLALAKGDVGLGNVDNTADTAKPVSTAQQTALDLKANSASLGTAAPLNVPASGDAASGEVVKGSDTRLTNTRTPTDGSVSIAKLASGVLDTDGTLAANSDSKLASQKAVKTAIAAEATARTAATDALDARLDVVEGIKILDIAKQDTTAQTGISTTITDITGVAIDIVPDANLCVILKAVCPVSKVTSNGVVTIYIRNASNTVIWQASITLTAAFFGRLAIDEIFAPGTIPTGTYKLSINASNASVSTVVATTAAISLAATQGVLA